jgi:hypothetical protein
MCADVGLAMDRFLIHGVLPKIKKIVSGKDGMISPMVLKK